MIKLKQPMNYRGRLLEAGQVIGFPGDYEQKLINNGVAEKYSPVSEPPKETPAPTLEEVLETKTKAELLGYIEQAGIEDITDKNRKEEIITALIEAVNNGFTLELDTGE